MKKVTLLFILLTSSLSFSQIVLSEDFESGLTLPIGWTNNDIAAGGDIWTFATGGEAVGFTPPNTIYYVNGLMSGNYAIFNSDGYGNNSIAENAALESPAFDCTGFTDTKLSFNHFFTTGYGGAAFVEIFDGTTWIEVASYSAANDFGAKIIDVPQLNNVANAQVRFRWTGDYAWGWAFDDVVVQQPTVNAPDPVTAAVTPTDGAIDVPIQVATDGSGTLTITPFDWTAATTGDAATSFNINIGITAAGNDIGTIPGFSTGGGINYTWENNTTYYWSIDAVNVGGTTPGPIWSFTTTACAVALPDAVTTPAPNDIAIDVPIVINPDGSRSITPFSWVEALTGDPADSFDLNLGATPTGNDIGSILGFTSGGGVTYTWEYDTTYYWYIDANNCAGTTNGTIWSFTTGSIPGDICSNAQPLSLGVTTYGDTSSAGASTAPAGSCGPVGFDQDLWYSFVATSTGEVSIATNADHIVIYDDCAAAAVNELACVASGATVNGLTNGATYYARAYNNGTARLAGPISITISESTLSTNDFQTKSLFTYYPNPVKNILNLNAKSNISNITVYNMLGQEVLISNPKQLTSELDLTDIKSGAYFVKVTIGNTNETIKIIKE